MINDLLISGLKLWSDLYSFEYRLWGLVSGLSLLAMAYLMNTRYWVYCLAPALFPFVVVVPLFIWLPDMTMAVIGRQITLPIEHLFWFSGGVLIPPVAYVLFGQPASKRLGRTDIRNVADSLPGELAEAYDPRKYFNSQKGVFLGLSATGKPTYISTTEWRKSHCQVMGTTGAGKGVIAGVLLTQSALAGEAVVVIDPKNDEYLPLVLASAAKTAGVPFISIDLHGKQAQWHPFYGKDEHAIDELLTAGLGMADTGSDADYYRVEDRSVARKFANFASKKSLPVQQLFTDFYLANPELIDSAKKLYADLEELFSSPVVQAAKGLDISSLLEQGAIIYVRGSTRNPRLIKLQKIFLLTCMQAIEIRNRDTAKSVILFLDEFKYVISKSAIEALGTIRDKRAHVMVAHQSLSDLKDVGSGLSPDAVIGGVVENCAFKISYQVRDPDTADWLSRLSGTVLYTDESRSFVKAGHLGGERVAQRTLRQAEKPFVDVNQLFSLPNRAAVCFGIGSAKFIYTSPMQVDKDPDQTGQSTKEATPTCSEPQTLAGRLVDVD